MSNPDHNRPENAKYRAKFDLHRSYGCNMPSETISEDGYWQLVDGEWVATEMQKEALRQGVRTHDYVPVFSEDGFWELIDGDWKPSEKQIEALAEGATPHYADTSYNSEPTSIGISEPKFEIFNSFANLEPQHKMYVFTGIGLFALLICIIIVVASISPDTVLEEEFKDSDSDGIRDDLDRCLAGSDWTSNPDNDYDSDGCHDDGEDLDDDNDGIVDLEDDCQKGRLGWFSSLETDFDGDGCTNEEDNDDDNDGWSDGLESLCSTNSRDSNDIPIDTDNDQTCDLIDSDDDGDGWSDSEEEECGTNPKDDQSLATNSDLDSTCDFKDPDDDNDGWTDVQEEECNANPLDSDSFPLDSDEDGICNSNEEDNFERNYNSQEYSIYLPLELSVYNYYKNKDHTIVYETDYISYSTPSAPYVIQIAGLLEDLAIEEGYTSMIDKAEFILAFVGTIPYILEGDDEEYPKYPIEMLWDNGGDCEDSSALYISIMDALGYDTILLLLEVKNNASDEWGGHAMVGISIPGHTGEWQEIEGSSTKYFYAETTAWYDGYDGIGINWWYDMQNLGYDDL